jgi:hypothetical protein
VAGARLNRRWHLTSYFCELLPAERLALCKRSDVRGGSIASVWPRTDDFRSTAINRHRYRASACLKSANSGSRTHSINSSQQGDHLAVMFIRAARLAAILLHIARGLRPAKGPGL